MLHRKNNSSINVKHFLPPHSNTHTHTHPWRLSIGKLLVSTSINGPGPMFFLELAFVMLFSHRSVASYYRMCKNSKMGRGNELNLPTFAIRNSPLHTLPTQRRDDGQPPEQQNLRVMPRVQVHFRSPDVLVCGSWFYELTSQRNLERRHSNSV